MELLERWKTTRDLYAAFVPIVNHTLKLAGLGWTTTYLEWCATRWAVRENFMLNLWMVAGIVREREKELARSKGRVERDALEERWRSGCGMRSRLRSAYRWSSRRESHSPLMSRATYGQYARGYLCTCNEVETDGAASQTFEGRYLLNAGDVLGILAMSVGRRDQDSRRERCVVGER